MKKDIENLPDLLRKVYPNNGNMNGLADRLEPFFKSIYPYIGNGKVFMKNHFNHKLLRSDGTVDLNNNDFFSPLMEGLWHLHVVWSLRKAGFKLCVPEHDDDAVIVIDGQKIAFEVTLSDIGIDYLSPLSNDNIIHKMINVVKTKDRKIAIRSSGIPSIIVVNEQRVINDGFRLYGTKGEDYASRLDEFNSKLQSIKLRNSVGVIYSNIKYGEYFAKNLFPTPILVPRVGKI